MTPLPVLHPLTLWWAPGEPPLCEVKLVKEQLPRVAAGLEIRFPTWSYVLVGHELSTLGSSSIL